MDRSMTGCIQRMASMHATAPKSLKYKDMLRLTGSLPSAVTSTFYRDDYCRDDYCRDGYCRDGYCREAY